jgi:tyrosine-protein kinase Etk/Wzc
MVNNMAQYKALIDNEPTIDIKRSFSKYLYHWPLFLIGIAVCLACGIAYLKITKPVYQVKASLIIKNDQKSADQKSALKEIDLINSNKVIENEIEIIKSNQLIKKVINDLELWVTYKQKDGLFSSDLYKNAPVTFQLMSATGLYDRADLSIQITDDVSFLLITSSGEKRKCLYGTTLTNSFGKWVLKPTKNLGQFKGKTIKIGISDPDQLASQYQKYIDASLPNKLTSTVVLSLEDRNPQRAKDILNRVIYVYNSSGADEKNQETENTLKFLDQRIASLEGGLTKAEQGIEGFKSSRGLTDITSDSKVSLENMQANSNRLNEVNVQLDVIERIERYVNSPQSIEKSTATLGISDPGLSNLIGKLADLQLQRDKLLATTPETNPDFDPINRQITSTRAAIKENVKNIKLNLQATRSKLQSYNSNFQSSIKEIPTQERQYGSIKRQQSIKENLYNYLLQKREELSVKYASELANDHVVDKAYVDSVKGAKMPMILGVSLLIGIILPTVLLYLRNSLSDRITDVKEIQKETNLPVISELEFEEIKDNLIVDELGTSPLSEQIRALRIALNHTLNNQQGMITLFTSSISGEGKSFTSKNLSIALAYSGKKTIILELDLRKPQLYKSFNLQRDHKGISDFLNGRASYEDVIQNSGIMDNLHFISSGASVPNPSELMERDELKQLFAVLKDKYDCVIIDSPPVHLVSDALVLSKLADVTLYLIRQGYTNRTELKFIKHLNENQQLVNVHIVFNGIERVKYGYGYEYNHNYYAHYSQGGVFKSIFSNFSSRF